MSGDTSKIDHRIVLRPDIKRQGQATGVLRPAERRSTSGPSRGDHRGSFAHRDHERGYPT